mmetsp:Transcript_8278/g.17726  ORF Transcript_8278/g.17726 Transcript_8278/m.17726 type:complete len:477 (+) Transcript_8278:481-1911(+)
MSSSMPAPPEMQHAVSLTSNSNTPADSNATTATSTEDYNLNPAYSPANLAQQEAHEENMAIAKSRIQNLQFFNATSFLLAGMLTVGVVFWEVREEGIWGADFEWMRYQTLVTPAPYVHYIWYVIYLTQALYIYASIFRNKSTANANTHASINVDPSLPSPPTSPTYYAYNPLVGYNNFAILSDNTGGTFKDLMESAKHTVAFYYPFVGIATVGMVYSYDAGNIGTAFFWSLVSLILGYVIVKIQVGVMNRLYEDEDGSLASPPMSPASAMSHGDNNTVESGMPDIPSPPSMDHPSHPLSHKSLSQYIYLRLPFELFAGYALTNVFLYFNVWLDQMDWITPQTLLIVGNASLVMMLVIGCVVMWRSGMLYGVGASLIWYFVGVAVELHTPSQPIYNEFTDEQITATQATAAVASTIFFILFFIRMIKSIIKRNLFGCVGWKIRGAAADDDEEDEDDIAGVVEAGGAGGEIRTGYVQA